MLKKAKNKLPNLSIVEELKESSLEALSKGHFLHSVIIIFQIVESLLRIAVRGYGKGYGISEENLKKAADEEISFPRLVLHFDLIYPDNCLGKRLLKFNTERNYIIHHLFFSQSIITLKNRAEKFCLEGVRLNQELQKLLEV